MTEAIDSHIDVERWNRLLQVEEAERDTVRQIVEGLETAAG